MPAAACAGASQLRLRARRPAPRQGTRPARLGRPHRARRVKAAPTAAGLGMQLQHDPARLEDGVAERTLAHPHQQIEQRIQRLRRGDPLERAHRLLGDEAVGHQAEQRERRGGVADLAERVYGGQLEPHIPIQQIEQRRHRVGSPHPAERLDRRTAPRWGRRGPAAGGSGRWTPGRRSGPAPGARTSQRRSRSR